MYCCAVNACNVCNNQTVYLGLPWEEEGEAELQHLVAVEVGEGPALQHHNNTCHQILCNNTQMHP